LIGHADVEDAAVVESSLAPVAWVVARHSLTELLVQLRSQTLKWHRETGIASGVASSPARP
jgi:hypothetical protein